MSDQKYFLLLAVITHGFYTISSNYGLWWLTYVFITISVLNSKLIVAFIKGWNSKNKS